MNTTRIEHIASAIDFLNSLTPAEYVLYTESGHYHLHRLMSFGGGRRTVLTARTKREFLALVEAYTQGVRDHA